MNPPLIEVVSGSATDAGLRRRINEDSHIASSPVFLVADGMGGHQAGEVASAAVIAEFAPLAGRSTSTMRDVRQALERARHRVADLPLAAEGAGTTLTGVVLADVDGVGCWLTLNVGDSRTYLLSDGELEQISVDHSLVQELIDSGELDPVDAASDTRRNVITRAIGGGSNAEADYWVIPAQPGDRVLVCSDGLTGELGRGRIDAILQTETDPQAAATRLVHEAMLHGGRDNITAIVVDALAVHTRENIAPHDVDDVDEDTRPRVGAGGDRS
jgi:protein phosphatase